MEHQHHEHLLAYLETVWGGRVHTPWISNGWHHCSHSMVFGSPKKMRDPSDSSGNTFRTNKWKKLRRWMVRVGTSSQKMDHWSCWSVPLLRNQVFPTPSLGFHFFRCQVRLLLRIPPLHCLCLHNHRSPCGTLHSHRSLTIPSVLSDPRNAECSWPRCARTGYSEQQGFHDHHVRISGTSVHLVLRCFPGQLPLPTGNLPLSWPLLHNGCIQVFPRKTKDKTGIIRNIFHWLMTWPTLVMYCCVELVAFLEVITISVQHIIISLLCRLRFAANPFVHTMRQRKTI